MAFTPALVLSQLLRYGAVGLVVNAALYLLYLVLTAAGLAPIVASTLAFALGIPVSLAAHGTFTFRVPKVSTTRRAMFAAGYLVGYAVQIGTLTTLSGVGLPHEFAQLIAVIAVALVLFVFQKRAVFMV